MFFCPYISMVFQYKMISIFVKSKALEQEVATVSRQRIALTLLSNKVDKIQSKIDGFVKRVQDATSGAQLSTIQDALSQCYGNIEKLQNTEIDAIVTGKNTTRTLKKQLSKRTVTLLNIIEGLVTEIKIRRKK
jgi:galactitol-specific phosphotransferase system IIB component